MKSIEKIKEGGIRNKIGAEIRDAMNLSDTQKNERTSRNNMIAYLIYENLPNQLRSIHYATVPYEKRLDLDSTIKFLRNQSEYKKIDTEEQNRNENRIKRIEHTRYHGETQRDYINQEIAE
jgi:hypothetical protein